MTPPANNVAGNAETFHGMDGSSVSSDEPMLVGMSGPCVACYDPTRLCTINM